MDPATAAAWVASASASIVSLIAIGVLIYGAGKLSNRVENQERWRAEHLGNHETWDAERREDLKNISRQIDNLWGHKFGGGQK